MDKQYDFLAYSNSQLRSSSCWFFQQNNMLSRDQLLDSLGNFDSIPIPAKKAARVGLNFAASTPFINNEPLDVQYIDDDFSPMKIAYTDGIGMISTYLMGKISKQLKMGGQITAIQVRYRGAKGVIAINENLKDYQIMIRSSMVKYQTEQETEFDILDYSKYRSGTLNRQIIILLLTLGVDPNNIEQLQNENLKELQENDIKDASIFQACDLDEDNSITNLIRNLMNAGFDTTQEPFISGIFKALKQRAYMLLRRKTNIFVKDSARLMGIIDEHNILQEGEVFVRYSPNNIYQDSKIVEGEVMITRNPCLHPGDIKLLRAVNPGDNKFENILNCVVFPKKGKIPITNQIAGGDLDGDQYFVAWDPRLIPKKTIESMRYDGAPKPKRNHPVNDISAQMNFFLDYITHETLGKIDNSHLALADQSKLLALDKRCIRLAEMHSDAVDYPKTGEAPQQLTKDLIATTYPDYMEQYRKYESQTVIGKCFRQVKVLFQYKQILQEMKQVNTLRSNYNQYKLDLGLVKDGWDQYMESAVIIVDNYHKEIKNLLELFEVDNEFELISGNISNFDKWEKKSSQETNQLQNRILENVKHLKQKYRNKFYDEFKDQPDSHELEMLKASAWFVCSYYSSNTKICDKNQVIFEKMEFRTLLKNPLIKNLEKEDTSLCWFTIPEQMIKLKKSELMGMQQEDKNQYIKQVSDSEDEFI